MPRRSSSSRPATPVDSVATTPSEPDLRPPGDTPGSPLVGPFGEPIDLTDVVASIVEPGEAATIAFVCDDDRVPRRVMVVSGTEEPRAVHDVADMLERALSEQHDLGGLLLVSMRPDEGPGHDDFDRLLDLTSRFDRIGVELLDWWICTESTRTAMRAAAGLPNRW